MSRWLRGLLLAVALSGCTHHLSDSEQHTVSELTTHMTTRGLGRYLIDLPPSWRYGGGDVTLYYGLGTDFKTVEVTVIDQGVTPAQFQAAVDWRTQRIKAVTNSETNTSMLVGTWPVDVRVDDGQGGKNRQAVLLRYYQNSLGGGSQSHELHLLLGGTYVRLTAESYEGVPGAIDVEKREQVESRLKALSRQIFLVKDPARAGPGFILGPIIIRGPQDHEQATFKFYDPQRRDITLTINSSAVTPDEERHLLQRSREPFKAFREAGADIHILRQREHPFAGMGGEEILFKGSSKVEGGKTTHELAFTAETYRPDPSLMKPTLTVQLETGPLPVYWESDEVRIAKQAAANYLIDEYRLPDFAKHYSSDSAPDSPPTSSSLTDAEGMAVWDAILPTLRPRQGAVQPPKPQTIPPSRISPEQAEADRRALDAFIASTPDSPSKPKE